MLTFKQFACKLNESSFLIYHGDNYNTTKLIPKLMNNGNNQEGIGIYFSDDIKTAKDYGKDVISLNINERNFINSRDILKKHLSKKDLVGLLKILHQSDNESFFYYISDYIEVSEPEEVEDYHIEEFIQHIEREQIRNFQIDMANNFGVEVFVKAWNFIFKNIHGTYYNNNDNEIWYCVINDKLKVSKVI